MISDSYAPAFASFELCGKSPPKAGGAKQRTDGTFLHERGC